MKRIIRKCIRMAASISKAKSRAGENLGMMAPPLMCPSCLILQGERDKEERDAPHRCVYRTKLSVLAKRFRLLQRTLEQQQVVIEKQQRRLEHRRSKAKQASRSDLVLAAIKRNERAQKHDGQRDAASSRDQPKPRSSLAVESLAVATKEPMHRHGSENPPRSSSSGQVLQVHNPRKQVEDGFISARRPSDDDDTDLLHRQRFPPQLPSKHAASTSVRTDCFASLTKSINPLGDAAPTNPRSLKRSKLDQPLVSTITRPPSTTAASSKSSHVLSHVPPASSLHRDNVNPSTKPPAAFKYIEVVRKRDERMALPGHACDECARYYAALGDEFDGDQFACSRHRAKWEPYATPEDFWRLSFPDSAS
ncbi:hypothetical protein H257_16063 [Aphanomyces astaci]|uniref:DNA endonuclease activator Ctp1 C-terminal domain-containing protein n=1 Tax=Aphanomyces astaci TaxID=112090 RepID=W4FJY8_APHAT|nr:hypothetical protein H257_16063 [Aphanomyces astaci]ETV67827.1 hypothetical protein H257_16063 [Aphanomyces astaci]|eukprot:XP_009842685.1 hypothetical protein H257_16063 [Aphanomyces astaci]